MTTRPPGRPEPEVIAELRAHLVGAVARLCPPWLADQRDDLVQMAVMKILRNHADTELTPGFVYRVAYTTVIDEIRRQKRRNEVVMSPSMPDRMVNSGEIGPELQARGSELGEVLVECMHTLMPSRRQAVTLYLQDHPVPEIARLLGCDRKKASNLVYRGLDDLRAELRKRGIEPP